MPNKKNKKTLAGQGSLSVAARVHVGATNEQFRLMMEQMKGYAIFMLDPQGYVSSWSNSAGGLEGYGAAEIIGKSFSVFHTGEDVKSGIPQRELETAISAGSLESEGWRLRKDGSRFWAFVTITALYDESGELLGFGQMIRDATERHELDAQQNSRTIYERLFENAPDAVVMVDDHGVIRRVNQQAEVLFGRLPGEMVGKPVESLMPERFQKGHQHYLRGYFKEPAVRQMGTGVGLYGLTSDGREIPVDILLSAIETSAGTWALAVIRDITQQMHNQASIMELNNSLKIQIEQLTASNKELESYSHSMAHELGAPLRHIIELVDQLNERDQTGLDETSRRYLQVITQAAHKMGNLIEGLLTFSRLGRAVLRKVRIDFDRLVRDIVGGLAEDNQDREIDWEIAPFSTVVGDAALLHLVMVNLLENAVKFTQPRARAKIEIGALEDSNETLFYVRDNGVGFDMRYVHKLFGLFQRLHSNEEFKGTGVGLALVRRIVVRHGGRVWADGKVDGGATIWFSLPKAAQRGRQLK